MSFFYKIYDIMHTDLFKYVLGILVRVIKQSATEHLPLVPSRLAAATDHVYIVRKKTAVLYVGYTLMLYL